MAYFFTDLGSGEARKRYGSTGFNKFPSVLKLNGRFSRESVLHFCLSFQ